MQAQGPVSKRFSRHSSRLVAQPTLTVQLPAIPQNNLYTCSGVWPPGKEPKRKFFILRPFTIVLNKLPQPKWPQGPYEEITDPYAQELTNKTHQEKTNVTSQKCGSKNVEMYHSGTIRVHFGPLCVCLLACKLLNLLHPMMREALH